MTTRIALDGNRLMADARDLLADTIRLRRRIHAEPELGNHLPMTQAKILDALSGLDLEIRTGDAVSSVVATLIGDGAGPTLVLRGDMDALPMPEDTGEKFASSHTGVMHACGHDAHVAMLAGAARLLHARRRELRGSVKFLFQPGEEGHHGARYCIEEGLLENPKVDAAFALHVFPNLQSGSIQTRPGPMLASSDEFTITVRGRGGHASAPYMAVDPIPVACEMVTALQTHITRTVNVFKPAVLTVGRIIAGTTTNVIPESAELTGTVRTVDAETREQVLGSIEQVVQGIAGAHGCRVDVELDYGYPVTVNDAGFTDFSVGVLTDVLGADRVSLMPAPIMGSEDWSYVLERVPGLMAFLGVCPDGVEPNQAHACHSNLMRIDEDAMAVGIAAHAALALSYLA